MADNCELEIQGFDELMQQLEQMGKDASKIENKALKAGAEVFKQAVIDEVPEGETGNLKESIKTSKVKRSKETGKFIWVGDVDRKAEYGWMVNFGTSKMAANPFFDRAYELAKDEVIAIMTDAIREGLGL